jgi:branched-chain amino acid transport system permease protein
MILSGTLALIVSAIALRTVDSYFLVCTLGIQVVVFSLMHNWTSVTRGAFGIPGIPHITLFGVSLESRLSLLLLTVFFVILIYFFINSIAQSSFGRTLKALSEDEIFTQSLGKNVYLTKVISFTISAILAAIPGVLYAHYITYIDPSSFTIDESIFILSIVIIGGMRNLWGIVIASVVLVLLPEGLRFIGIPSAMAANVRQIIYGGMLVVMIFINSKGMIQRNQ